MTIQIQLQISIFIIVFTGLSDIFISCLHGNLINIFSKLDWNVRNRWSFCGLPNRNLHKAHIGLQYLAAYLLLFRLTAKKADSQLNSPSSDFLPDQRWQMRFSFLLMGTSPEWHNGVISCPKTGGKKRYWKSLCSCSCSLSTFNWPLLSLRTLKRASNGCCCWMAALVRL